MLKKISYSALIAALIVTAFTVSFSRAAKNHSSSQNTLAADYFNGQTGSVILVARYYPVVQPNSYFVNAGGTVSFNGKGFAPGEIVSISQGKAVIDRVVADSSGTFSSPEYAVGYKGGNQFYYFSGSLSQKIYSLRIHVANWRPYILLNDYYLPAGSAVQVTGKQFGSNENVLITYGNLQLATIPADAAGMFNATIIIPESVVYSKHPIIAKGLSTGLAAAQIFTVAP